MKKRFSILFLIIFIISMPLLACGNNSSGSGEVFDDFKFLPKYPAAEKVSYKPAETDGTSAKGIYKISDVTPDDATKKYTEMLKKAGWEIKEDESNPFIDATKGEHKAIILFTEESEKTQMQVLAR